MTLKSFLPARSFKYRAHICSPSVGNLRLRAWCQPHGQSWFQPCVELSGPRRPNQTCIAGSRQGILASNFFSPNSRTSRAGSLSALQFLLCHHRHSENSLTSYSQPQKVERTPPNNGVPESFLQITDRRRPEGLVFHATPFSLS